MKALFFAYSDVRYDPRILKQCTALFDDGYDVYFYGVDFSINKNEPECDFNVDFLCKRSSKRWLQYLQYFYISILFAFKTIRHLGSTKIVFVSNMPNFLVFAPFLFKLFDSKIILDIHDDSVLVLGQRIHIKIIMKFISFVEESLSLRFADRVITVNTVLSKKIEYILGDSVEVFHNSPDYSAPIARMKHNLDVRAAMKLVFIGNFGEHYGLDRLIDWVEKCFRKKDLNIRLDIYGGGILEAIVAKKIRDKDLSEVIKLYGRYVPSELPVILKKYDFGVALYSINQMTDIILPVKVLEYTAYGLPVISVRIKTLQRYFTDSEIYFVDNINDFFSCLKSTQLERYSRMTAAFKVLQKISWEKEKSKYLIFVKEICFE